MGPIYYIKHNGLHSLSQTAHKIFDICPHKASVCREDCGIQEISATAFIFRTCFPSVLLTNIVTLMRAPCHLCPTAGFTTCFVGISEMGFCGKDRNYTPDEVGAWPVCSDINAVTSACPSVLEP